MTFGMGVARWSNFGSKITPNKEYPDFLRSLVVNNSTELTNALGGTSTLGLLRGGDHLIFPGTIASPTSYPGNFTLNRSGAVGAPIVLRAANVGGAVFPGQIAIPADLGMLWGLDHDLNGGLNSSINLSGSSNIVRRCHIHNSGTAYDANNNFAGISVTVTGVDNQIILTELDRLRHRGISGDVFGGCRRLKVSWCHFHDFDGANKPGFRSQAAEGLQFGQSYSATKLTGDCTLEYSLFERMNGSNAEVECFSNKSSGNNFYMVTADDCREASIRHGRDNRMQGIWLRNNTTLHIYDQGTWVGGVTGEDAGSYVWLECGDCSPDEWRASQASGNYVTCFNAVITRARAGVHVGQSYTSQSNIGPAVPTQGTVVEQQLSNGPPVVTAGQGDNPTVTSTIASGRPWADAVRILPSMVGPFGTGVLP